MDRRLSVQVHLDTSAHIVGTGSDGDVLLCDIDTDAQALGVDIGEMMLGFFGVFVRHIEADMVDGMNLHLIIDGSCYDVSRSEGETRVVFLHKLFAVRQPKDTSVTAHSFGDEVGGMGLFGIEEARRMELDELHIFNQSFSAIDHGDTVAGSYLGIGGSGIDCAGTACSHEGDTAEIGIYLLGFGIEDIGSVALDIRCTACYTNAQMVLRDNLYCEMVLQHIDELIVPYGGHQSSLYLCSGVIGMMENTEL